MMGWFYSSRRQYAIGILSGCRTLVRGTQIEFQLVCIGHDDKSTIRIPKGISLPHVGPRHGNVNIAGWYLPSSDLGG